MKYLFITLMLCFAGTASAQLVDTLTATYYTYSPGNTQGYGYALLTPLDTMNTGDSTWYDTIYYYWPLVLAKKYTFAGQIELDTLTGNGAANAGTFVFQEAYKLSPDNTDVNDWTNIDTATALPGAGAIQAYTGTINGIRLRMLVLVSDGNQSVSSRTILKE